MIDSAMSWIRRESGLGIVVLSGSSYAFLHVLFSPEQKREIDDAKYAQMYEVMRYGTIINSA